jgi:methylated-DNA-[protein]-cysteine S-methyltransferase
LEKPRISIESSHGSWFGVLVDDDGSLVSSAFGPDPGAVHRHLVNYSKRILGEAPELSPLGMAREMIELFEGKSDSVSLPFNDSFVSTFQRKVIHIMSLIPRGRVTTYGLIAKRIHSAPRPVGGAVSSNPWPLFVPCHRVVNANLTLGNYSMCGNLSKAGTDTKRAILLHENVPILNSRIDPLALWRP